VLPDLVRRAEVFLNLPPQRWSDFAKPQLALEIAPYVPLATRVDPTAVKALLSASTESLKPSSNPAAVAPTAAKGTDATTPEKSTATPAADAIPELAAAKISIDEFARVDLRIARIVAAEHVDGADKLLKLTVDLGGERRTVFAGIRLAYHPEQLVGRLTVVVANLEPRKMRFGMSEGMVLAAGPGGQDIFLLTPDTGAIPGMKVK
jgi:methionyl-tRNA synthetase